MLCSKLLAHTAFLVCVCGGGGVLEPLELPNQYGELEMLGKLHPTRLAHSQWQTGTEVFKEISLPQGRMYSEVHLCSRASQGIMLRLGFPRKWNLYFTYFLSLVCSHHSFVLLYLDPSLMYTTCTSGSASGDLKLRQRDCARGEGVKRKEK